MEVSFAFVGLRGFHDPKVAVTSDLALGHVERRPDPEDRQAKRIYRTAKAKRASAAAIDAAQRSEHDLEQLLGEIRLDALRGDLKRIVEAKGGTIKPPIDGLSPHPELKACRPRRPQWEPQAVA